MRKVLACAVVMTTIAVQEATAADEIGRYQAVNLPSLPGAAMSQIMILDTRTGDLWTWTMASASDSHSLTAGIIYMGRAIPGAAPGEVVASFTLPAAKKIK